MSENHYELDEIDRNILRILIRDGRINNLALAEAVHLSPTPCARRVKRLEDLGIIEGYRAELNRIIRTSFRDPNDPRSLNISVVNVAAPAGSARKLQNTLQGRGYANVSIADEGRHETATTISGKQAARLQQELGFGTVSSEAPTAGADATIRLGNDTPPN